MSICWTYVIKHMFNMFGTILVFNIMFNICSTHEHMIFWTYVAQIWLFSCVQYTCTHVPIFFLNTKVFLSVKTILSINLSLVKLTEFCKKGFQFQSVYVPISIRVQHFECIHHIAIVRIRQCLQEPTCLDERFKLLIINRSVAW